MQISPVEKIIRAYIAAYINPDLTIMEKLLDLNAIFYITNAKAGVDKIVGRQEFLKRIQAMNIASIPEFNIHITQVVTISENQGMMMVEVTAKKNNKKLHNFAANLITIRDGKICESWMVEALPQYSAEFWLK